MPFAVASHPLPPIPCLALTDVVLFYGLKFLLSEVPQRWGGIEKSRRNIAVQKRSRSYKY